MHPAVTDAAVAGIPHEVDGEHPAAFVVVKRDAHGSPLVTERELADFTNGIYDSTILTELNYTYPA